MNCSTNLRVCLGSGLSCSGWTAADGCVWKVFNPAGVSPGVGGIVEIEKPVGEGGGHCRFKFVAAPAFTACVDQGAWYCVAAFHCTAEGCLDCEVVTRECLLLTQAEVDDYPTECKEEAEIWGYGDIVGGPWCTEAICEVTENCDEL